ncbi:hypothetical protein MPRS_37890 [Mycobacterium paraseoulense]|nr:DUF5631 domain-containing protein [Mycobacterium paraseoulense]BBZ72696.1 hypothetical protein MPRS_37890 [Mycobacterium paraseoulense]
MPAFSSPIDCTPWVIGGLWPAELATLTTENATLAEYLKVDLQRIADNANQQLRMIKRAGLADLPRQAEEARVIDEARARAVRRVESTIRQLHSVNAGYPRPQFAEPPSSDMEQTRIIPAVTDARPSEAPTRTVRKPRWRVADRPPPVMPTGDEPGPPPRETPAQEIAAEAATAPEMPDVPEIQHMEETQVIPSLAEVEHVAEAPAEDVEAGHESLANGRHYVEAQEPAPRQDEPEWPPEDDAAVTAVEETRVIPAITEVERVVDEPADSVPAMDWAPVATGRHHVDVAEPAPGPDEAQQEPEPADTAAAASIAETQVIPAITEAEPVVDEPADAGRHHAFVGEPAAGHDEPRIPRESPGLPREKRPTATGFEVDRLNRLLEYVVRQEPRLNWAVGERADGTTVLVTDLAHGWIPAGITLPAGVRLLEPEPRTGRVGALIGDAVRVVTYAPGDSLRRSADFAATKSSVEPRELPAIEDLGRALSETTRRFDGLPRIVQRLADAAAADAVIIDQEVDVLRVHLDTARYQLLVQYPTVNPALLLKCLLMAATEGLASGDAISANYHLAWYRKLAGPPPDA